MERESVSTQGKDQQDTRSADKDDGQLDGFGRGVLPALSSDDPRLLRPQNILQMQRQYGNTHIRRMLAQRGSVIQRVGTGQKWTVKTPSFDEKLGISIPAIPVKLDSVALSGECSVTHTPKDSKDESTQAKAGATAGGAGAPFGVQAEVERKWAQWKDTMVGDISITSKGSSELTTGGGKIGVDIVGVKIGRLSFALKFNILKYDAEKSKIDFATLSFEEAIVPFKDEYTDDKGDKVTLEFKGKAEWKFKPDWVEIGKWLAEQFAKEAALEVGIALGFVAGGIATIAAAYVTASLGDEIRGRIEGAVKSTNDFCSGFQQGLTGDGAAPASEWGAKGVATAQQALAKSNVPVEAFKEEAKKRNLRSEAFAIGWPQIRSSFLAAYKEEHYIEWAVYGEDGPGYKLLNKLLDANHLNF